MICPNCSYKNPHKFHFCGQCGTRLVQINNEHERRQLTVMFCDLVGSTSLSQGLDPESFHKLINEYQTRSEQIINNLGGYIAQFLGDGILVYFGYPKAHEDDASRAVKAGMEIREEIKNIDVADIKPKNQLKVRIGIHTGDVVIGEVGGSSKKEQLAMGDVPNIAALIQKSAKPNEILLSANTYNLTKGFYNAKKLTPSKNKRSTDSIDLYRVTGETQSLSRFEAHTSRGFTLLVGRDKELKTLLKLWNEVNNKSVGKFCSIYGEAGVGKSRLVYEFKQSIADEPHMVLECQCWDTARNSPLSQIVNLLERILEFGEKDSDEIKIQKIEKLLRRLKLNLKQYVPLIMYLLSISLPRNYTMPMFSPEKLRKESMEAFIKLLVKFSNIEPIIFVVEDLHWVDPSTLNLLTILVTDYRDSKILSLFTYRPEFNTDWKNVAQIKLEHLDKTISQEMVEKLVYEEVSSENLVKQIIDRSDGIPLFIEEITKSLIIAGVNNEDKSKNSVIPITLNDYLMARLDKLDETKEVAQVGSIIGREFDQRLVKSVLPLSQHSLKISLNKLMQDEIIFRIKPGKYLFKHALIQDAAYESISRKKREELHQKIAQSIENKSTYIKENQPDLLAHHYEQAGDLKMAITYLANAGELALSKSAPKEAVVHLEKGLNLLTSIPTSKDKDLMEISLLKFLQIAEFTSGFENINYFVKISEKLIGLCKKLGIHNEIIVPLQGYISVLHLIDCKKMVHFGKQLKRYAKKLNNTDVEISSLVIWGDAHIYSGKYVTASNVLNKALHLIDSKKYNSKGFLISDKVHALGHSAYSDWQLGYIDIALTKIHNALKIDKRSSNTYDLPFILVLASMQSFDNSKFEYARDLSKQGMEIASDRGVYIYSFYCELINICSNLSLGYKKEIYSKTLMNIYDASFKELNMNPVILQYAVITFMILSDYQIAKKLLINSIKKSTRSNLVLFLSQENRLYGETILKISNRNKKKAEELFLQSLKIASKDKTKFFELKTSISYSNLLLEQKRDLEAKKMLSRIVRWFDGRNKTEIKELNDAKSLLERLS